MNNYTIQLHGNYFTMTTTVDAADPDTAYMIALGFLKDHYGFTWVDSDMVQSWDCDYNGATV